MSRGKRASPERRGVSKITDDPKKIERALQKAFVETVELHRKLGLSMVFWENGKVVKKRAEVVAAMLERKKRRSAG